MFRKALAQVLRGVLAQCLLPAPDGRHVAAYGVLIPDADTRRCIREDGTFPEEACNPRLESDIQRLQKEGKVQEQAAHAALEALAAP